MDRVIVSNDVTPDVEIHEFAVPSEFQTCNNVLAGFIPITFYYPFISDIIKIDRNGWTDDRVAMLFRHVLEFGIRYYRLGHLIDPNRLDSFSLASGHVRHYQLESTKSSLYSLTTTLSTQRLVRLVQREITTIPVTLNASVTQEQVANFTTTATRLKTRRDQVQELAEQLRIAVQQSPNATVPEALLTHFNDVSQFTGIETLSNTRIGTLLTFIRVFLAAQHKDSKIHLIRHNEDEHTIQDENEPENRYKYSASGLKSMFPSITRDFISQLIDDFNAYYEDPMFEVAPRAILALRERFSTRFATFGIIEGCEDIVASNLREVFINFGPYGIGKFKRDESNPLTWLHATAQMLDTYDAGMVVTMTSPRSLVSNKLREFLLSVFVLSNSVLTGLAV